MAHVDPWDIKVDDERQEDSLETFIIFCEDDNSEPLYFRSFSNDKIKVNAIPNQKQGKLNILNALQKCKADGLVAFDANCYRLIDGITEHIWCVYDRDLESEQWENISDEDHLEFDYSIQTAQQTGLHVAWSNDAFELWILLHFEDMPARQRLHRNYIYGRLTEIFKVITPRTEELDAITGNIHFNYKNSFKKRSHFLKHILPLLKNNTSAAITRAEELEAQFANAVPFHMRNPCTLVHHLVKEIIAI
ncbi:RloB family protein [Chitinophaga barathri]|uniref:RloB domain-containing protein n=1 Tax=Chitinophaga barathri TaxID=1647451 RepID=A0A3N4M4T6_9BACT|nr:RloB family protein [Chitinophaga barathri]RPD38161.1 RloB domain-containing protein [Chitinophaga barathri]